MLRLVPSESDGNKKEADSNEPSWKKEYDARLCSAKYAAALIQSGPRKKDGKSV